MTVSECGPDCPVDCALHTPAGGPAAANASARARAREASAPDAHSPADGDAQTAQSVAALRDRLGGWARTVAAEFTPPDIVTIDRPSLSKAWAYAARGEWTGPKGLPRRAGQSYAGFAIAAKAVLYVLDWIIERPARLATAVVLVVVIAQFPPLSLLI